MKKVLGILLLALVLLTATQAQDIVRYTPATADTINVDSVFVTWSVVDRWYPLVTNDSNTATDTVWVSTKYNKAPAFPILKQEIWNPGKGVTGPILWRWCSGNDTVASRLQIIR